MTTLTTAQIAYMSDDDLIAALGGPTLVDRCVAAINSGKTAEEGARALYLVLVQESAGYRQNPDREVIIRSPEENVRRGFEHGKCWVVSWESSPVDWAYATSMHNDIKQLCEPYYSFDLCLYPNEWN